MSVVTNTTGPNSQFVTYVYGDDYIDVFNAIADVITSHGWTLFDSVSANSQVFRSNGPTTKYVRLMLTAAKISTVVYESWNATTHIGSNLCYGSDSLSVAAGNLVGNYKAYLLLDATLGGSVYVFVTENYMVLANRTNGVSSVNGEFIGCFGVSPTISTFATVPRFGFATGNTMVGDHLSAAMAGNYVCNVRISALGYTTLALAKAAKNAGSAYGCISVPRTTENVVGVTAWWQGNVAAGNMCSQIGRIQWHAGIPVSYDQWDTSKSGCPYTYPGPSMAVTQAESGLWRFIPTTNDPDSGLPRAYTPYFKEMNSSDAELVNEVRGKIYGPKIITKGTGVFGNVISIPCASDLIMDKNGTPTDHMIVPVTMREGLFASYALPL
jgi:hypothetical protein